MNINKVKIEQWEREMIDRKIISDVSDALNNKCSHLLNGNKLLYASEINIPYIIIKFISFNKLKIVVLFKN